MTDNADLLYGIPVLLITVISTFVASSGFWAYLTARRGVKSATTRLIMGLGYDKAAKLGFRYIDRGYITKDELEDFKKYLYDPYIELGGNGVIERIMAEVMKLPIKKNVYEVDIDRIRHE